MAYGSQGMMEPNIEEQCEFYQRKCLEMESKLLAAERLADEAAALVTLRQLGSRSPLADALLDYREPPTTERSDRIAALTTERDELRKQVLQWQPIGECDQCVVDEQYILLTAHFDGSFALDIGFAQIEDDALVFEDEFGEEIEEPSYFIPLAKFPVPSE